MALGVVATNGGTAYDVNSGTDLRLVAWDGLEVRGVRRLSQRTAAQRGETDIGYTLAARFVTLGWVVTGASLSDYYAKRRFLTGAFMPLDDSAVRVVFTFDDGRVRAVEGFLEGEVELASSGRTRLSQRAGAVLKCGDPRLFDPTQKTASFAPLADVEGWEVPWEIPWAIAPSSAVGSFEIDYADGDETAAPEFPVITITGPIDSPRVANETTGQVIELDGLSVAAGQTIVIDLKRGIYGDEAPTVRTGAGVAVDRYLTTDSDINGWHLAPAGEPLVGGGYSTGVNVIALGGSGGNEDTEIEIAYYDRYLGL